MDETMGEDSSHRGEVNFWKINLGGDIHVESSRSIPPGDRLNHQNRYCDIDTQVTNIILWFCPVPVPYSIAWHYLQCTCLGHVIICFTGKQSSCDEAVFIRWAGKMFVIYIDAFVQEEYIFWCLMFKVEEINEILEMKITHRKNLERRKAKFG